LHSAFLAAARDTPITLAHIASAVMSELVKEGREVPQASLGLLAAHLPGEAS